MTLTFSEKPVAFFRAAIILALTLMTRFLFPVSAGNLINVDICLAAACAYCFISVFLFNESKLASFVFFAGDAAAVSAILYLTGGIASPYTLLFYVMLAPLALRNGLPGALIGSTLLSLPCIFLLVKDPLDVKSWGIVVSAFYAVSLLITQFAGEWEKKTLKKSLQVAQGEIAALTSAVEKLKNKVAEETIFDPLTGHHNIKYFNLQLEEEFSKARRHKYPFSLAIINVDNFKQYNASFGQKAADEALKVLSKLLAAYVRNSDLVAREDGKDKFTLILPYTDGDNAKIPLERYMDAVSRYRFDDKNPNVHLTVSCGIATFPSDANSEQEILDKAELALRRAKTAGKNKIFTYPAAVQPMI